MDAQQINNLAAGVETDLIVWSFLGYGNIRESGLTGIWYGDHPRHGELISLSNFSEDDAAAITLVESLPELAFVEMQYFKSDDEPEAFWRVILRQWRDKSRQLPFAFKFTATSDLLSLAIVRAWIAFKYWEAKQANG